MRYLVVCTASACQWLTLSPGSKSRSSARQVRGGLQVYEVGTGPQAGAPTRRRSGAVLGRPAVSKPRIRLRNRRPPAARDVAFLNKGADINLTDERVTQDGSSTKWSAATPRRRSRQVNAQPDPLHHTKLRAAPFTIRRWPGGLRETSNRTKNAIHSSIVDFPAEAPGTGGDRVQWNAGYSESVHTFANTITPTRAAPTRGLPAAR